MELAQEPIIQIQLKEQEEREEQEQGLQACYLFNDNLSLKMAQNWSIQYCSVKLQLHTPNLQLDQNSVMALNGNLRINIHHHIYQDCMTVMVHTLLIILHNTPTNLKQVISTSKATLDSNSTGHWVDRRIKSNRELNSIVKGAHCNLEEQDIIIKVGIQNSKIHFLRSPFSLVCC